MSLMFPTPATPGELFTSPDGIVWVYDGAKWKAATPSTSFLPLSGGQMTGPVLNLTAPDPPAGDSSQLVPNTEWIANTRPQNRNRIINGNFLIDQRNGGNTVTAGSYAYTCDRWVCISSPISKFTFQAIQGGGITGISNNAILTSISTYTPTTNDVFLIQQSIEGYNVSDFRWGFADAGAITLSFLATATTPGLYSGSITNSNQVRSYVFTYNISQALVWQHFTVTIPGDTVGIATDWPYGPAKCMTLTFDLGSGSAFRTTPNTWVNGNFVAANGAASLVAANGATLWLTNVQLELGTQATPFDWRPFGEELALCQRYYVNQSSTMITVRFYAVGNMWSSETWSLPVSMRTNPTLTYNWSQTLNLQDGYMAVDPTNQVVSLNVLSGGTGDTFAVTTNFTFDAEL